MSRWSWKKIMWRGSLSLPPLILLLFLVCTERLHLKMILMMESPVNICFHSAALDWSILRLPLFLQQILSPLSITFEPESASREGEQKRGLASSESNHSIRHRFLFFTLSDHSIHSISSRSRQSSVCHPVAFCRSTRAFHPFVKSRSCVPCYNFWVAINRSNIIRLGEHQSIHHVLLLSTNLQIILLLLLLRNLFNLKNLRITYLCV